MPKVKFVEGVMYGGVYYAKDEVCVIEKDAAAALGSSVEILKKDEAEAKPKADPKPKNVANPPKDKMIKSPAKAKDAAAAQTAPEAESEESSEGDDNGPKTPASNE